MPTRRNSKYAVALVVLASAATAASLAPLFARRRAAGRRGGRGAATTTHAAPAQTAVPPLSRAPAEQWNQEVARLSRGSLIDELSAALAHELNQPLTSILSNAQAAQRFLARPHPDVREVKDILCDIVAEAKRTAEMIRKLRTLFQKGEVQWQSLDVNQVLQDVLRLVRCELIERDISVDASLADGLPAVSGDPLQVQQVLLNLIRNACDAMRQARHDDRRLLVVSLAEPEDQGVRVSIRDRGCGVPAAQIERIFDPFYTTKPSGMGLGLAVSRTIVRAHAGKLWLENNSDGGVTAHLLLRATPVFTPPEPGPFKPASPSDSVAT